MKIIKEREINLRIQLEGDETNHSVNTLQHSIWDHLEIHFPSYHLDKLEIDLEFIAHCKLSRK